MTSILVRGLKCGPGTGYRQKAHDQQNQDGLLLKKKREILCFEAKTSHIQLALQQIITTGTMFLTKVGDLCALAGKGR